AIGGANRVIAWRASRHRRLLAALRKRRFVPVVQPIVDATTGACLGAEVLMRWKHPSRGLVPPLEFIDFAERSGLIVPMSALLMGTARAQLLELAAVRPSLVFSFNVTPAQLRQPGFAAELLDIFDAEPLGPSRVVLELTERDLVDAQVRDQLSRLRDLGFRIAIDDFGTGQSSLALLQELPVDRLKIDRAFVRTIEPGVGDPPVLEAIVDLAHRLRLGMIAEGVETPEQRDWLRSRGVQALQGYLHGRPMTVIDFREWLGRHDPAPGAPLPDVALDLAEVADAVRAAPALRRDRWYHLRRYPDCLLGSELVDWWVRTRGLSRDAAVRLGRRLVAKGWLLHVHEEHDFEDGPFFYQLVSQQAQRDTVAPLPHDLPPTGQTLAWLQGEAGVQAGTRVSGLLLHRNAVSGREVVDALSRAGNLSRERAIQCGHALLRAGRLRHVFEERGFSDAGTAHFYFG
nr:EAL domain-containing protein [Gemmatimonadaceae bacterium]